MHRRTSSSDESATSATTPLSPHPPTQAHTAAAPSRTSFHASDYTTSTAYARRPSGSLTGGGVASPRRPGPAVNKSDLIELDDLSMASASTLPPTRGATATSATSQLVLQPAYMDSDSENSVELKMRGGKKRTKRAGVMQMIKGLFEKKPLGPRRILVGQPGAGKGYPANMVKNQKYNMITFLPLVLFHQFRYFFNLYFLVICFSQLIPELKVGYLFTYFSPLVFVLAVTLSKEAMDDIKRYQRDKEANSQLYTKVTPAGHVSVPSSALCVGDIILLEKDQRIPADLILLKASDKTGSLFIRTDQLDGETDWKLRNAVPSTQLFESEMQFFTSGLILEADRPHKDIYDFVGTLTHAPSSAAAASDPNTLHTEPLGVEHTLWMNTVLASGAAYALVMYTGKDTRAVMNTSHASSKFGLIDEELNRFAKVLFGLSLVMSVLLISCKGFVGPWEMYLMRFFILFSSIIPLSLRVNVDMGRLVYAHQIGTDPAIPNVIVRNSSIPEELGRIGFLLSDKTGTLTQNDMEMKKLHLGTMSYGADARDDIVTHLNAVIRRSGAQGPGTLAAGSAASTESELTHLGTKRGRRDISSRIYDIVQALALCHNVTPVTDTAAGTLTYQASSPDEVAIVRWTQSVGMTLVARDRDRIRLQLPTGTLADFAILELFPFTSESKRMGIVVQDVLSREIFFYEKGADVVMTTIVQRNDWLDEECDNMAREGLRTLVIGRKKLSEEAYEAFHQKYAAAKLNMTERQAALREVIRTHLEHDLELLGLTGVEDRLQDDVKITLETLRNAGIRIWMLTGDKVETATCIALSSRLVARNQNIFTIQKLTGRLEAMHALNALQARPEDALVIDGQSLHWMLTYFGDAFLDLAVSLPSVVCCRCSPTQKADVANRIKLKTKKRVCCIGDGGNDVSMIQAAHVGIGIVGKEGKQASLAADFSLTQFSHIARLLIWHGRNSYKRTAKLSLFVIHRGYIISIMQAVFSALFYFAPLALYQGYLAVGYATLYTMFPVFSLVMDRDITEDLARLYPELYTELTKGRALSPRAFFTCMLASTYQGGIIMLLAMRLFETDFIHVVAITFTALILNELLMVALQVNTWHYLMVLAELFSILVYVLSIRLQPHEFDATFTTTFAFFWKVSLITVVSFVPLFLIKIIRRCIHPPNYTKLS